MDYQKNLIVFYSWSKNTKAIAEYIQKKTGADILELETANKYPNEYQSCVRKARQEGRAYAAELRNEIPYLPKYQTIFVGSPCWLGTIASPLRTFLKDNDFAGKELAPFMTHGISGLCIQEITSLCPGAKILDGLSIFNEYQVSTRINRLQNMGDYKTQIDKWLKRIGR